MEEQRDSGCPGRLIRRYQRSERARRAAGSCRFDPSCSRYALEAFETRPFLVALAMTTSRLVRCNPLVRRVSPDPVRRSSPLAPRPNAMRTLSVVLLAGGAMVLVTASAAMSEPISGGCTGTVNGRDATTLTKSDPLSVEEGELIAVEGNVPAEFANQNPNSYTTVKIEILADVGGVTTDEHQSTGTVYQSESIDADDYLEYGAGLYRVEVTNRGPGWICTYTGYVKMDTNPLTTPIGLGSAAAVAIGGIGVVVAKGTTRTPRRDWFDRLLDGDERARRDDTLRAARAAEPDLPMVEEVKYQPFGPPCCLAALALPLAAMPVLGTAGGGTGVPAASTSRVVWQQVSWKRGHAVWGFLAGGLFGLGLCVLLWQYAVWLLTIWTVFVVPLVVAFASAVYAWYGRRYVGRVTATVAMPSSPTVAAGQAEERFDASGER
jgi:hypothetical protein